MYVHPSMYTCMMHASTCQIIIFYTNTGRWMEVSTSCLGAMCLCVHGHCHVSTFLRRLVHFFMHAEMCKYKKTVEIQFISCSMKISALDITH